MCAQRIYVSLPLVRHVHNAKTIGLILSCIARHNDVNFSSTCDTAILALRSWPTLELFLIMTSTLMCAYYVSRLQLTHRIR